MIQKGMGEGLKNFTICALNLSEPLGMDSLNAPLFLSPFPFCLNPKVEVKLNVRRKCSSHLWSLSTVWC